jgi:predicted ATPase
MLDTLTGHLSMRRMLLVLDNLEHLLTAGGDIGDLVATAHGVSVIATSREPLRLSAEREHPVAPLDETAALELFCDRAHAVIPEFSPDAATEEVCRRLDGLPLAIELAAARTKTLSVVALLDRLEQRLPLLTSRRRDVDGRQRTLRATIEWSYDLLDDVERRLFARLAIFAGGWRLDAAEQICDADLDVLQSLADKSLVRTEEGRFRMLETIREYALERLNESGELEQLRARHADHFVQFGLRAEPELTGADQHIWLARLAGDYENLRAALEWCVESRPYDGLRLASALVVFWFNQSFYRDGLHWLEQVLAATDDDATTARAGALWGAGLLWALVGEAERAAPRLDGALALARRLDDPEIVARSLNVIGLLAFFQNDARRSRQLFEEAAETARAAGDKWGLADSLGTLGSIYPLQGEFDQAEAAGTEARAIGRQYSDLQGIRMANFGLALTAVMRGDLENARILSEEGLAICREIGDLWFVSYFLWILATAATAAGDVAIARAHAEESLKVAREIEGPLLVVCALDALAGVERAEGHNATARSHLLEAAELGRRAIVPGAYLASVLRGLGELALEAGELDAANAYFEESLERARAVEDAWGAARTQSARATLAEQRGEHDAAIALAQEALAIQQRMGDKLGVADTTQRIAAITSVSDDGGGT